MVSSKTRSNSGPPSEPEESALFLALAFLPLGLRIWERRGPAIAAGITWSIMPPVLEQMAAGRLTQVCMVGIPLAIAGILGVVEEGRKKDIWMAGLGMALTAFGYWFYALFILALCPFFIGHGLKHRQFKPMFKDLLRAAGITAAVVLPLALHVFWPKTSAKPIPSPNGSQKTAADRRVGAVGGDLGGVYLR